MILDISSGKLAKITADETLNSMKKKIAPGDHEILTELLKMVENSY